ncbi:MAG TPA: metallophosphoesterase, partial [Syntrophothermus lipocalidus]|nr:metallophosphoesterase [Syntrophothermus lipocalidus]
AGIDRSRPIILMDHQPIDLDEALNEGVDLQLSGHTHLGQLFPNRFVTRRVYEVDWGYLRKDNLQVIVSCGFGTWGPPIRVGNHPEIVVINVRFGCN